MPWGGEYFSKVFRIVAVSLQAMSVSLLYITLKYKNTFAIDKIPAF